jgi:membrane protease YdiL (CAAX protease family)
MQTKTAFAILFLFFAALFVSSRYFGFQFGYILALHLGLLSCALFFLFDRDMKTTFSKLGIPGSLRTNTIYIIVGLSAIFATLIVLTIALNVFRLDDQAQVAKVANQLPLIVLMLAIVLAPFSEELFFRGLLMTRIESAVSSLLSKIRGFDSRLAENAGAVSGVVLSSLIFGALHVAYGSVAELVGAFAIGLILALVFRSSKSIVPPIVIHFIYNSISITVLRGYP